MINGTYEISSTGTAADLFVAIADAIKAYTDWTVEVNDDLEITATTSIPGATVHIYDQNGTNSSTTTTSLGIVVDYVLTSTAGSVTSSNKISYGSGSTKPIALSSRKVYMHVYEGSGIYYVEFTNYKQSIPLFVSSTAGALASFGLFKSTQIGDGTAGEILVAGQSCYDPTDYTQTAGSIVQTINSNANGVVMLNYLVSKSSCLTSRFDNIYNCSTLTAGLKYSINGKKYLAFNANTLFEQ